MEEIRELTPTEAATIRGGEILTLTIVLTYLAISILTVVVWKLYTSSKAKVSLPGGGLFEWTSTYLNRFSSLIN